MPYLSGTNKQHFAHVRIAYQCSLMPPCVARCVAKLLEEKKAKLQTLKSMKQNTAGGADLWMQWNLLKIWRCVTLLCLYLVLWMLNMYEVIWNYSLFGDYWKGYMCLGEQPSWCTAAHRPWLCDGANLAFTWAVMWSDHTLESLPFSTLIGFPVDQI